MFRLALIYCSSVYLSWLYNSTPSTASAFIAPISIASSPLPLTERLTLKGTSQKGNIYFGGGFDTRLWALPSDDHGALSSSKQSTSKKSFGASESSPVKKSTKRKTSSKAKSKTKKGIKSYQKPLAKRESLLDIVTNVNSTPPGQEEAEKLLEESFQPKKKSQSDDNTLSLKDPQESRQEETNYAYNIPTTGISLSEETENSGPDGNEKFETFLTPITDVIVDNVEFDLDLLKKSLDEEEYVDEFGRGRAKRHDGVARIDTIAATGAMGEEPVRWIVSLEDPNESKEKESFAMVDLPPYSDKLANEIRNFMDPEWNSKSSPKGSLDIILVTNQQSIHYDAAPAVYVTRKSDLIKWKKAFPGVKAITYRLDTPRDCRGEVSQILDGYGPWGWERNAYDDGSNRGMFVETGRPLTIVEWDDDTKTKVISQGETPPDDQDTGANDSNKPDDDEDEAYSPAAIRKREEKYSLLAVYTPGHTFGSITYIFPKRGICCSGYALPMESPTTIALDYDEEEFDEFGDPEASFARTTLIPPKGPRLDYQGYIATSASRPRQMSSANSLINNYIDRFHVVLPARGDVVVLDSDVSRRKRDLLESVGLYQKIGEIYGRLGIVD